MSKIVCDVCGTSYPETAEQCPICGTAKTDTTKSTTGGETGYAYVKGGRFSHANVRKRNAGKQQLPRVVAPAKSPKEEQPKVEKKPARKAAKEATPVVKMEVTTMASNQKASVAPEKSQPAPKKTVAQKQSKEKKERRTNIVLALIALVLVLGILAVAAFIFKDWLDAQTPSEPAGSSSTQASGSTEIPCTGLRLALTQKTFTSMDKSMQLSVSVRPSDTTDPIRYESSDESVAIVDDKGIVYPVANGTATIYVYCGEFSAECYITCDIGVEPTEPSVPDDATQPTEPTDPTEPAFELKLNREDFSLNGYGDSHVLYNGEIDPADITWTSSDETVATVTNGKVVAVGNGSATITAEYMGQKATCKVHCSNVVVSSYELWTEVALGWDITVSVGDSYTLKMVEKEGGRRIPASELIFALSKDGVVSIDENGKFIALKSGTVTVTVIYGEVTLKSIIRVK